MTTPSSRLLSIGEFAAATQLSQKALRIYDEQRLLPPARIDTTTGYRYYSSDQVPLGRLIRTLREMNLALTDIAKVVAPKDGAEFSEGTPIQIAAIAIDLEGAITHVEFFDGDNKIGESVINFFREPDPGTPIHHEFEWLGASAGLHVLTARTRSLPRIGSASVPLGASPTASPSLAPSWLPSTTSLPPSRAPVDTIVVSQLDGTMAHAIARSSPCCRIDR